MRAFVIIGLLLAALVVTACSQQPATPSGQLPSQPTTHPTQPDQTTQQTADNAVNNAVVSSNDTTQLGSII